MYMMTCHAPSLYPQDPKTHKLTDLISFYHLPSTVIGHDKYNTLRAAYSFYNVSTVTPWIDLMQDALILAKNVSVGLSMKLLHCHDMYHDL